MPRASGSATRPAVAAKNVSSNAGHSEPSCSTPAYQKVYRPVTRSMTRIPDVKDRDNSTSSRRSTPDDCFSTQIAASRPTVTRARTPHQVTKSAWKPLTQPAVLSEELKRASAPATNPNAKRSRVTSSQAAKDSASKANRNARSDKNNRNGECASQVDQLDGTVISSLPTKLQSDKSSCDVVSKRKPTFRSQGAKLAAPSLLMAESETETGKDSFSVVPLLAEQLQLETAKNSNAITKATIGSGPSQANQSVAPAITEAISSGTSQVNQSVAPATRDAIVRGKMHVNQFAIPVFPEATIGNRTRQVSQLVAPLTAEAIANRMRQVNQFVAPLSTEAVANRTRQVSQLVAPLSAEAMVSRARQVNQFVAPLTAEAIVNRTRQASPFVSPVVILPRQHMQTNNLQGFTRIPLPASQASVPAGATAPMVVPKLEIGNANAPANVHPDPAAYRRALLIKQQEQLLQQYKLANSQSGLHIKGPAVFEDDDAPEPEPLGTRCALCKLDLAFQPHGGAAIDPSAPPVIAVLACHHTFHSRCIEDVYGLAEPSQCVSCLDSEIAH